MKFFKKKQKPDPIPLQSFPYTICMRNGIVYKCSGKAVSKDKLAFHLSDVIESFENMYFTTENGGKILLWAKEIDCIIID